MHNPNNALEKDLFDKNQLSIISIASKKPTVESEKPYFFIRVKKEYQKIRFDDIKYLEASGAYTHIITTDRNFTLCLSLKNLLVKIPDAGLVRCHRSFAVNTDYIHSFDDTTMLLDSGEHIPVSRSHKKEVYQSLPIIKI